MKKKRIVAAMLACALLVGALYMLVPDAEENTDFCVKIVHTNDIHARVEENESSGIIGLPKLKSIIDSYAEGADMDLVIDSGDMFHGQSIATLVQGESIAKLVKACGYDAMTAGNHDWN
ncbi:MAG: metallophosphoesterase, partial [Suilimivivens sp.]